MTRIHAPTTAAVRPHTPSEPPPPPPRLATPAGQPSAAHRGLVERATARAVPDAAEQRAAAARKALAPFAGLTGGVSPEAIAQSFAGPRHARLAPAEVGGHATLELVRQVLTQHPEQADALIELRLRGTSSGERAIVRQAVAGRAGLARYQAAEGALAAARRFRGSPESQANVLRLMQGGMTVQAAVSQEGSRIASAVAPRDPAALARDGQLARLAEVRREREQAMTRAASALYQVPNVERVDELLTGGLAMTHTAASLALNGIEALATGSVAPLAQGVHHAEAAVGHVAGAMSGRVEEAKARYEACSRTARRLDEALVRLESATRQGSAAGVAAASGEVARLRRELVAAVSALESHASGTRRAGRELDTARGHVVVATTLQAAMVGGALGHGAVHAAPAGVATQHLTRGEVAEHLATEVAAAGAVDLGLHDVH